MQFLPNRQLFLRRFFLLATFVHFLQIQRAEFYHVRSSVVELIVIKCNPAYGWNRIKEKSAPPADDLDLANYIFRWCSAGHLLRMEN